MAATYRLKLLSDESHWTLPINIGIGDSLVPSGNKPLLEPMSNQVCVAVWHN